MTTTPTAGAGLVERLADLGRTQNGLPLAQDAGKGTTEEMQQPLATNQ